MEVLLLFGGPGEENYTEWTGLRGSHASLRGPAQTSKVVGGVEGEVTEGQEEDRRRDPEDDRDGSGDDPGQCHAAPGLGAVRLRDAVARHDSHDDRGDPGRDREQATAGHQD